MHARQLLHHIALTYLPVSFWRRRITYAAKNLSPPHLNKQLLIDVSAIAQIDVGTGIQRVVRNLYQALLATPPAGYRICPIAATRTQAYHYLPTDFLQRKTPTLTIPVQVGNGDIFLGLDLSAHIIPRHLSQLWNWKQQGVCFSLFIYDLLPVLSPHWFNAKTTRNFHHWLRAIALLANNTITISRIVQTDVLSWMYQHYQLSATDIPCDTIPLGAELDSDTINSPPVQLPQQLAQRDFILMVGTIEPRKGHDEALAAFEALWATGNTTTLVIAGKQGWKVESFIQRLQIHPETDKRLIWLNNPDDNLLRTLYQQCLGVLTSSKGEGYGLPLIEAAYFHKSVLARDLPIFREIAGENITYFQTAPDQNNLSIALPQWLIWLKNNNKPPQLPIKHTWQESCRALTQALPHQTYTPPYKTSNL
jgi:glycosyltransferase involved in cell wall biosynthesis